MHFYLRLLRSYLENKRGGEVLSVTQSATLIGIEAILVSVEVEVSCKLPAINIVGLPDNAVKESRERIRVAIQQCGFQLPNRRITVNLAPADVRKEGAAFDLPIAIGILKSTGQLETKRDGEYLLLGELSLSGGLRPITGALSVGILARKLGKRGVILPRQNVLEISCVSEIEVIGADSLVEAAAFLAGEKELHPDQGGVSRVLEFPLRKRSDLDLNQVISQAHAKRALEIAAAGGHHLLLIGSPGCGKTMLAERLPTILPSLTVEEMLETSQIYSALGMLTPDVPLVMERPFCAPHHTVTKCGLIGGGQVPKPGSASLAHNGVLFLDELGEFDRPFIDALRQPMESGKIVISRLRYSYSFPAKFQLIAAMNPCLCGYLLGGPKECSCSLPEIRQYKSRVSGPILDRIDLRVELPPVALDELTRGTAGEPSAVIRERVEEARLILLKEGMPIHRRELLRRCAPSVLSLLKAYHQKLHFSARGYQSLFSIAQTIAALERESAMREDHLLEAMQYRSPVVERLGEAA
ncbi:MAG: YifB family Mg chelatase-like AAA ATPase [Deltaproteobacteria bacterium]|nr:YifB family Mg chelatase-like AAA ATPase [Deltaproteobacteria bacterium]